MARWQLMSQLLSAKSLCTCTDSAPRLIQNKIDLNKLLLRVFDYRQTHYVPFYVPKTTECGKRPVAESPIVSGKKVKVDSEPWMVIVKSTIRGSSYYWLCGGTLVASSWVLTAAHCKPDIPLETHLTFSLYNLADPSGNERSVTVKPDAFIVHPLFDRNLDYIDNVNDIALIKLRAPLEMNVHLSPACLPKSDLDASGMKNCLSMGFGSTRSAASRDLSFPKYLLQIDTRAEMCANSKLLCGYTKKPFHPGGICVGDSGGPLLCPVGGLATVVGVSCMTNKKCDQSVHAALYTNVHDHMEWIESYINQQHV